MKHPRNNTRRTISVRAPPPCSPSPWFGVSNRPRRPTVPAFAAPDPDRAKKNPASKYHASWAFQAVAIWTDRNTSPEPIRDHQDCHHCRQLKPKRASPLLVPEPDREVPHLTNEPASRSILTVTLPAKTLRCSPASENAWSTPPHRYPPENPCHCDNSFFSLVQECH